MISLYTFGGWYSYSYKEKEPLIPPGRPRYLNNKGHNRPTTSQDQRHKNLLIRKRRNKKKRNKRSHKK